MTKDIPTDEKSYHEWLTEALARDEETWKALEAKLETMRVKQDSGDKGKPRDC